MSDKSYLCIGRRRRPDFRQGLMPALGYNSAPMGYTLSPAFSGEPVVTIRMDGGVLAVNDWGTYELAFQLPGDSEERSTKYSIDPGEHLVEFVVTRLLFFDSPKAGYASYRFSVEPDEMQFITFTYTKYYGITIYSSHIGKPAS